MAGEKYIKLGLNGTLSEQAATQTGGGGNENKIPALDATGRLDNTMMPVGVGPDTASIEAAENLSAGDFVNIYNATGTTKVRKADATTNGKEANGFVLDAATLGESVLVYFEGRNTQLTGLTGGEIYFLSTTAGSVTDTPPSTAGNVVQRVGRAISATELSFESTQPIVVA